MKVYAGSKLLVFTMQVDANLFLLQYTNKVLYVDTLLQNLFFWSVEHEAFFSVKVMLIWQISRGIQSSTSSQTALMSSLSSHKLILCAELPFIDGILGTFDYKVLCCVAELLSFSHQLPRYLEYLLIGILFSTIILSLILDFWLTCTWHKSSSHTETLMKPDLVIAWVGELLRILKFPRKKDGIFFLNVLNKCANGTFLIGLFYLERLPQRSLEKIDQSPEGSD